MEEGGLVFLFFFGPVCTQLQIAVSADAKKTILHPQRSNLFANQQPSRTSLREWCRAARCRICIVHVCGWRIVFLRSNCCQASGPRFSTVRDTSETWNFYGTQRSPASWRASANSSTGIARARIPPQTRLTRSAQSPHSCHERDDSAERATAIPAVLSAEVGGGWRRIA